MGHPSPRDFSSPKGLTALTTILIVFLAAEYFLLQQILAPRDEDGMPDHEAAVARDHHPEIVRYAGSSDWGQLRQFLNQGHDPNAIAPGKYGISPLMRSLLEGAAAPHTYFNAKLLLDFGADPNYADKRGRTALHLAAVNGSAATMTALIEAGGDPFRDIPGAKDSSPYAEALRFANLDAVTAIEATTEFRHPDRETLMEFGVFGKSVFEIANSELTTAEKEDKFREALKNVFPDPQQRAWVLTQMALDGVELINRQ